MSFSNIFIRVCTQSLEKLITSHTSFLIHGVLFLKYFVRKTIKMEYLQEEIIIQESNESSIQSELPYYIEEVEIGQEIGENPDNQEFDTEEHGTFIDKKLKIDDLKFMKLVEKYGFVLLDKRQTPKLKENKKNALLKLCQVLQIEEEISCSTVQVNKKLQNLKTRLKEKIDRKVALSNADKILFALLKGTDNPAITQLKCE